RPRRMRRSLTPRVKPDKRPHARLRAVDTALPRADILDTRVIRGSRMKLKGRTALVTGASRGIGRAVALALAEEGADVAVNYVSSEAAAKDVAEQIRTLGRRAVLAQADVADFPDTFRMAQEILKEFGHLDILV